LSLRQCWRDLASWFAALEGGDEPAAAADAGEGLM
jgi:hypothetical protein